MQVKSYRVSPLAEEDLEEIWLYTFEQWSTSQADIYINSFVATFEELALGKKLGRPCDIRAGYKKYLCGSHMIYFLEYADRIAIIRVLHQKQDVMRHLDH